jgi:hypothetical protein
MKANQAILQAQKNLRGYANNLKKFISNLSKTQQLTMITDRKRIGRYKIDLAEKANRAN